MRLVGDCYSSARPVFLKAGTSRAYRGISKQTFVIRFPAYFGMGFVLRNCPEVGATSDRAPMRMCPQTTCFVFTAVQ